MYWSHRRARRVLDDAAARIASGGGTSERTIMRIASLAHPGSGAAEDVVRFREVLARVGWREGRIARAERRVRWGLLAPVIPLLVCTTGGDGLSRGVPWPRCSSWSFCFPSPGRLRP